MEGAAVAQVAKERGLKFAAVKAISDDAAFEMPPMNRFIDENGRFATGRFLMYVALASHDGGQRWEDQEEQ